MKFALIMGVLALSAIACNKPSDSSSSSTTTTNANNTGVNERDRDGAALTPMDQGGGKDRDLTAEIRKGVMSVDGLSWDGKNVKIITDNGKVTLRGPVKDAAERAAIESKAKAVAGVTAVDNQLEIKK
ncbi:MAG: hypothetical protein JWP97_2886 [Labilithrix sp.]|nr:hypothetical protein [Labilithrix sp.]